MSKFTIVTSGSSYLDIDAYACCIALSELKTLLGYRSIAYSKATINSSVSNSLRTYKDRILKELPSDCDITQADFIIVDISDPNYTEDIVKIERVVEVYDHHTGFESFWSERIGNNSNIHFIGAAATLVYNEWVKHNMVSKMSEGTAKLLLAGILDNTLNLLSSNTTEMDIKAKTDLCLRIGKDDIWCRQYFSEVQAEIESDLKTAFLKDIKKIRHNDILPTTIGQLAIWDAHGVLEKIEQITSYFNEIDHSWLINIIDICSGCSYFVCNDSLRKRRIESLFNVNFENDIAKLPNMLLRKEILKKAGYLK